MIRGGLASVYDERYFKTNNVTSRLTLHQVHGEL